jgi:hypothetical protein
VEWQGSNARRVAADRHLIASGDSYVKAFQQAGILPQKEGSPLISRRYVSSGEEQGAPSKGVEGFDWQMYP